VYPLLHLVVQSFPDSMEFPSSQILAPALATPPSAGHLSSMQLQEGGVREPVIQLILSTEAW